DGGRRRHRGSDALTTSRTTCNSRDAGIPEGAPENSMARVTLIFPPATDPRSPHLALPCLAAALRDAGCDVELLDLDVEGLHALLAPDRMAETGRRAEE